MVLLQLLFVGHDDEPSKHSFTSLQTVPLPVYPEMHEQTASPLLLEQLANEEWHPPLFVRHGFTTEACSGTDVLTPSVSAALVMAPVTLAMKLLFSTAEASFNTPTSAMTLPGLKLCT
jgi:hypothetical protein